MQDEWHASSRYERGYSNFKPNKWDLIKLERAAIKRKRKGW